MKKLSIILLSLSLFAFVACNNNAKSGDGETKAADKAEAAVDTKAEAAGKAVKVGDIEVPSFSDAGLNDYAKSYAEYVDKYKDAYAKMKTGDAAAFTALSKEGTALAQKASSLKSGMSEADTEKFQKYMMDVTKKLTDIASGK